MNKDNRPECRGEREEKPGEWSLVTINNQGTAVVGLLNSNTGEIRVIVREYIYLPLLDIMCHTEQPEGWVSVEDRLPEIGETVLAYRPMARETHDPIICITSYDGKRQKSPQGTEHGFDCWCHPTHWQPLPKPPEALCN